MSKQIQVPDIGADEVTVTEILVNVGDVVEVEQSLINVEGDKASMEVPAPEAGVIKEILVKVGDTVATGSPMMVFAQAGESAPAPQTEAPKRAAVAVSASIDVNVPDIGDDEVNVTEIMVAVGDSVEAEQSLITVEGDKASMEVPAPSAGIVKEIIIKEGDKVSTGTLIMRFATANVEEMDVESSVSATTSASAPAASSIVDVNVPDIGGDEVNVTEIMVSVGDRVAEEESILTVEGDKASMEVPAPLAGVVKEILVKSGDKVSTGTLVMRFEVEGKSAPVVVAKEAMPAVEKESAPAQATVAPVAQENVTTSSEYAHATPVVRRLAREFGVNLDKVKGTGRKGRILKEDVQAYVKAIVKQVESGAVAPNNASGDNGAGLGLLPWPK